MNPKPFAIAPENAFSAAMMYPLTLIAA